MSSIPLFESLQNEMHRRMGCPNLGCFNEGRSSVVNAAKRRKQNQVSLPSSWPTGFYGYICEGFGNPIDEGSIWTIGRLYKDLRKGNAKDASENGLAAANIDDIRAATVYGGAVDEVDRFGNEIAGYATASEKEKRIIEQEAMKGFSLASLGDAKRCLDVLSMLKNMPKGDARVNRLIGKIGHAFRTGSDGFSEEGVEGNVFPVAVWKDPFGYTWDDVKEHVSGSYGTYEQLGSDVEEG